MTDNMLLQQATEIATLIPRLQRSLFTLDVDDPVIELPVAQLRVCAILRDGPRAMSALSRELGISLSATTQIADRLERAGLVERVPEEDDRRVKTLQMTANGQEIMRVRRERRVNHIMQVLDHLAPEVRAEIVHSLQHLLEAAHVSMSDTADEPLHEKVTESA